MLTGLQEANNMLNLKQYAPVISGIETKFPHS